MQFLNFAGISLTALDRIVILLEIFFDFLYFGQFSLGERSRLSQRMQAFKGLKLSLGFLVSP
jgi:hypothetical protein